jgi:hypothetical protein
MSRYQPALLGGLFIGVVSALPVLGSANACCCLWVVVGGVLTVYLQQQSRATGVESAEAALGGLIAGAVGALLYVVVLGLILRGGSAGVAFEQSMRAQIDNNAQLPPEAREWMIRLFSSRALPFVMAMLIVPTYAVFGMLGALLGRALLKKKPVPPSQSV